MVLAVLCSHLFFCRTLALAFAEESYGWTRSDRQICDGIDEEPASVNCALFQDLVSWFGEYLKLMLTVTKEKKQKVRRSIVIEK